MKIFIITFIICFTAAYIFEGDELSKSDFLIILFISFGFTIVSYLREILSLNGPNDKKVGREYCNVGDKFELISFNDAIAGELIKIRSDLVEIRTDQLRQDKDYVHLKNIPRNFWNLYNMCVQYPYSVIGTHYKTSSDKEGWILILLDEIPLDEYGNFNFEEFNAESLMRMKSFKKTKINKDMNLTVHIYDPEYDKNFGYYHRQAKIISIKEGTDCYDVAISLEIAMVSESDHDYPVEENRIKKSKITREIKINPFNHWWLKFE